MTSPSTAEYVALSGAAYGTHPIPAGWSVSKSTDHQRRRRPALQQAHDEIVHEIIMRWCSDMR